MQNWKSKKMKMVNYSTPVKFNRVAAAFDEMTRLCSCESSGSEHSRDLSVLVDSFFEREFSDRNINIVDDNEIIGGRDGASEIDSPDHIELRNSLNKLLFGGEDDVDDVRTSILAEVEAAVDEESGDRDEFKRRLMARLLRKGFDAGLCKTKWEKRGLNLSGNYEYVHVNVGSDRYIVEVNLAGEFTVARPTECYADLLDSFPKIFVGKPEDLKQVIKLMSKAITKSMKRAELNVSPWRRLSYMQAKWFGFYRRTVNETRTENAAVSLAGNRIVGFVPVMGSTKSLYCREDFTDKNLGRISGLAAAFK